MTDIRMMVLRHPGIAETVFLRVPGEAHLLRLFTRNGWRPFGDASRRLALELYNPQEERTETND